MINKIIILALTLLSIGLPGFGYPEKPLDRILRIYHKADDLFHLDNTTPAIDSAALDGFQQVIAALDKLPSFDGKDTLLAQSWLKTGILLDVRSDYAAAKRAYAKVLPELHKKNDSLTFVVYVFSGACFYNLNVFDSASYFLLLAEPLADRFPHSDDAVRLYNTLGVLYYRNGNYLQAKNYFSRSLQISLDKKPFDTAFVVNIKSNIATACYRLGLYKESLAICKEILAYRVFTDDIYLNMGLAYKALLDYRQSLRWFRKVSDVQIPGVLNEMADALRQLHQPDSSAWCLDQMGSPRRAGKVNVLDLGLNNILRADLLADRLQFPAALAALQKAVIVLSRNFDNSDIYANPSDFTGSFALYRLFDALFKKAVIFRRLYGADPRDAYLLASFDAYKTALSLLRYIEKSYDSDDAKIFLKKNNTGLHRDALSVCLELYRLHPQKGYLAEAFMISESSKASIISSNLTQSGFNRTPGRTDELLQKERNIKYNIARLNVSAESAIDTNELKSIAKEKTGYQISLTRVQKELEQNGAYYRLKYNDAEPGIPEYQHALADDQALICFAETEDALHVFALTRSSFAYARIDSLTALKNDVASWLDLLKSAENGRKFKGAPIAADLYRRLIRPMQTLVPSKEEWIIAPDGFLYFLPFESLPSAPDGAFLLETNTISYQFAARMLLASNPSAGLKDKTGVMAFAPFASKGGSYGTAKTDAFSRLPSSGLEIAGLPGVGYTDSMATKNRFLQQLNLYPIIHLATHAVSSIDNTAASYIAFYPVKHSLTEDCLHLEELYGLDMNAVKLVIISACETGQGELVSNEGVISLARAFAYAGCASSISSLWKADDNATSFILQHFHTWLRRGYTKSKALRQARLDYIHSDAVDRNPAYWAHLVLIGDNAPVYPGYSHYKWWVIALILLSAALAAWTAWRKKIKKGSGL